MARNPKRPGAGASQSFTRAQVEGMLQLLSVAQRNGDTGTIMRAKPVQEVYAKFRRMKEKMDHAGLEIDAEYWMNRMQQMVRGFEFYGPRDAPNPAPGNYTVVGPLSEYRHSSHSIEHAAMLYLAQVLRDREAIDALKVVR